MAERLRVLVAGWLNSPHVRAWAELVVERRSRRARRRAGSRRGWPELELPVPVAPPLRGLAATATRLRDEPRARPRRARGRARPRPCPLPSRVRLDGRAREAAAARLLGLGVGRARRARREPAPREARARGVGAGLRRLRPSRARESRALARPETCRSRSSAGASTSTRSPRANRQLRARAARATRRTGPLVVSVRGLEPVYNPELLLEAFARVRKRDPTRGCCSSIRRPRRPPSFGARSIGSASRDAVTVLGNVAPEQLPERLSRGRRRRLDPSSDSSPRRVWEALACGRPVVVSDLPWARDELAPAGQALLVPLDAGGVAEAIERVLDDGDLASGSAPRGRAAGGRRARPGALRGPGRRALPVGRGGRTMSEPRRHLGAGAALSVLAQAGPARGRGRPEHRPGPDDRPVGKRPLRAPA